MSVAAAASVQYTAQPVCHTEAFSRSFAFLTFAIREVGACVFPHRWLLFDCARSAGAGKAIARSWPSSKSNLAATFAQLPSIRSICFAVLPVTWSFCALSWASRFRIWPLINSTSTKVEFMQTWWALVYRMPGG